MIHHTHKLSWISLKFMVFSNQLTTGWAPTSSQWRCHWSWWFRPKARLHLLERRWGLGVQLEIGYVMGIYILGFPKLWISSSNQTWLAGKSTIYRWFPREHLHSMGIFYCHVWLPEGTQHVCFVVSWKIPVKMHDWGVPWYHHFGKPLCMDQYQRMNFIGTAMISIPTCSFNKIYSSIKEKRSHVKSWRYLQKVKLR